MHTYTCILRGSESRLSFSCTCEIRRVDDVAQCFIIHCDSSDGDYCNLKEMDRMMCGEEKKDRNLPRVLQ